MGSGGSPREPGRSRHRLHRRHRGAVGDRTQGRAADTAAEPAGRLLGWVAVPRGWDPGGAAGTLGQRPGTGHRRRHGRRSLGPDDDVHVVAGDGHLDRRARSRTSSTPARRTTRSTDAPMAAISPSVPWSRSSTPSWCGSPASATTNRTTSGTGRTVPPRGMRPPRSGRHCSRPGPATSGPPCCRTPTHARPRCWSGPRRRGIPTWPLGGHSPTTPGSSSQRRRRGSAGPPRVWDGSRRTQGSMVRRSSLSSIHSPSAHPRVTMGL